MLQFQSSPVISSPAISIISHSVISNTHVFAAAEL